MASNAEENDIPNKQAIRISLDSSIPEEFSSEANKQSAAGNDQPEEESKVEMSKVYRKSLGRMRTRHKLRKTVEGNRKSITRMTP